MRWRWPWSSRQTVTGVRVRWWAGGRVPWCSRWNSSSLCGPSGMSVRATLVLGSVSGVPRELPVSTAVRRASTGWVVRVRPVGSVQVATASAVRMTVQPGRCLIRWWRRHRQSRLSSWVCPCGQGLTWSRSQNTAATWQPGNRQRRSRARIRLAIRFGGRYRSAPTPAAAAHRPATSRPAPCLVGRTPIGLASASSPRRRVLRSRVRTVGSRPVSRVAGRPTGAGAAVSSSRAPVTGWQVATCTAEAAFMLSVSHWWETRTGSPAPGPVTSTRASPPMTVPELGPTGSVPWFPGSTAASAPAPAIASGSPAGVGDGDADGVGLPGRGCRGGDWRSGLPRSGLRRPGLRWRGR